jgi:lysophospholipase L1-like esterase
MERSRRRTSPATTIALLAAVAAIVATVWYLRRPTPVAPGILFVGDSVTYLSGGELDDMMQEEDPEVLARVGFRSSQMLPLFEQTIRRRAERGGEHLQQVAILIGYNDVLQRKVEAAPIDRFMDAADRFDCAVWLTLPSVPLRDRQVQEWNRQVRSAARSHPKVHVVDDWRDAVAADGTRPLVTSKDGVHPTRAGARELASIYTDAVHRLC